MGFNFLASGSHGIFLSRCKCYSAKRQEIRPNTPITAKKAPPTLIVMLPELSQVPT